MAEKPTGDSSPTWQAGPVSSWRGGMLSWSDLANWLGGRAPQADEAVRLGPGGDLGEVEVPPDPPTIVEGR
jgi:hypothetical protein